MRASLRTVLGVAALLVCLGLIELFVRQRLERTLRDQLGAVLDATLDGSVRDVQASVRFGLHAVDAIAQRDDVRSLASRCPDEIECAALTTVVKSYLDVSGLQLFLLADRALLTNVGKRSIGIDEHTMPKLVQLTARASVIGAALDQAEPSLLLAVRLNDALVLIVQQQLEPLSQQIAATRVGHNGQTCTFDARGRMLTKSRLGYSKEMQTFAVQQAIAGRNGRNLDGYADFRGVLVVGAYRFLPEHGIGVVSEVDYADAYRTLTSVTRAFVLLGVLLAIVLAVALAMYARGTRFRARAEQAERRFERYGQYQIEAKLGEGGMGAVYLANHALLRRKAALKLLRADRSSPDAIERFEREVQVTSTLTHPNTVAIYDYGRTDDGTFYYVMEHLDGFDLQRLVALTGPLPQDRVLALLRQVCGSLAEAHAAGVVHRDIKPANLFVCTRGGFADTVKVLDFGIVHVGTIDRGEEPIVLGTPEYMAPELFESATRASAQSDLYSLGICAYYLLTGAPPFSGGATMDIGRAHLTESPQPLADLVTELVDPELEAAIAACVRKEPGARPSSANALIALLNRSKLAQQWTQADAAQWWATHWPVLRLARVSTTPSSSKRSIMVSTRA